MELYEYAVIYTPLNENNKVDKAKSKVLIEPTTILASSEGAVRTKALRAVQDPDADVGELDFDAVRVIVRPFDARF